MSKFLVFLVVKKLRMPVPGTSWFLDAAALGGWTARGTARVLQDRLSALPDAQRPSWMVGLSEPKVEELLTQVIADAIDNAAAVEEYMLAEREKGRPFDDIYNSVQPFIAKASRPLSEEVKDGVYRPAALSDVPAPLADASFQAELREQTLQFAPHRALALHQSLQVETEGRRGSLTLRKADSLSAEDLAEPLMLVGSPNGWNSDVALDSYRFEGSQASDSSGNVQVLRLQVPEEGVQFQVLSQRRGWEFILFPRKKSRLHRSAARQIEADAALGPNAGEKARSRDFTIKGEKPRTVDVKVSLTLEEGARLWLEEVS